jgi:phage shock protein A
MALINRVARIFKADFHAVLDQVEEPELLLKQAIRDMEDEIQATERRIALLEREDDALHARIREHEASARKADEQLDFCFHSGKDELAKGLVRRKLETGRLLKRLRSKIDETRTSLDAERLQAEENRQVLERLRQKAEVFEYAPACLHTEFATGAWIAHDFGVSDDEVEIAFLQEKDARSAS